MLGHGDVRFFDLIAPLYDVFMPPVRAADLRAGLAFAHRPVERVVDLGGGTGRASRTLGDLGVEATVFDYSAGMLRRARAEGVPGVRADAARLPLRDGVVDAVVITDALHHFPEVGGALAEATRVLAPGGVVVVREFDPTTRRGAVLADVESLAGMDSRFFGPRELAGMLEEVGLRGHVVDPGFGYTVVGVKPSAGSAATERRSVPADAGDADGAVDSERGR